MKHLLLTTIAAVLLVGCGPSVDIHEAVKWGNIEAVKQHLDAGTDVNAKGRSDPGDAIDIILMGDINVQTKNPGGAYKLRPDSASAFNDIMSVLNESDLTYCNMEGIYGQTATEANPAKKEYWYFSDPVFRDSLVAAGIDAVGLANNACFGDAELLNTLTLLDAVGIKHVGAGANEAAARAPVIITVGDTTFGFLQRTARYYGEDTIATASEPGVARIKADANNPNAGDLAKAVADVIALDALVDIVFFSHHVRKSGNPKEPYQTVLAEAVIDAGADFVFAHGHHINQGVEIYNDVVIMHSLSQTAIDWKKMGIWMGAPAREDGLVVKVKVQNKQISRVAFIPVARDDEGGSNNVYLTPPGTADGDRQIADVISQSPGVSFTTEGDDTVIGF